MIRVSIIIPAYNVENEIARCLQSCINQTYTNIEIIVVNDGSTDSSGEIIDTIKSSDERIVHLITANQGASLSRSTGIEKASGEYMFFLDGDDYIPQDAIYSLVSRTPNKQFDIVFGNYYQKLINSEKIKRVRNNKVCGTNSNVIASAMILGQISWSMCFKLIRKDYYTNINIKVPKLSLGEDGIGTLQILSKHPKIIFTNSYVYYYINRINSMVNQNNSHTFNNRLESFIYIRKLILNEYRLSKYVLFIYDIRFHINNFDNIELIINADEKLKDLKNRNQFFLYRIQLSFLLFLRRISLSLFNIAIQRIPSIFLYLQYCIYKPKMMKNQL